MDTVRLARDVGDVSGLLPTGISRLRDVPHQLGDAIKAALMFLGFEELPREDMPPRSIWTEPELLRNHFEAVHRRSGPDASGEPEQRNDAMRMLVVD